MRVEKDFSYSAKATPAIAGCWPATPARSSIRSSRPASRSRSRAGIEAAAALDARARATTTSAPRASAASRALQRPPVHELPALRARLLHPVVPRPLLLARRAAAAIFRAVVTVLAGNWRPALHHPRCSSKRSSSSSRMQRRFRLSPLLARREPRPAFLGGEPPPEDARLSGAGGRAMSPASSSRASSAWSFDAPARGARAPRRPRRRRAAVRRAGLGLDSIDALELVVAIEREFGVAGARGEDRPATSSATVSRTARALARAAPCGREGLGAGRGAPAADAARSETMRGERVAITGFGVVSGFGCGVRGALRADSRSGRSAIRPIDALRHHRLPHPARRRGPPVRTLGPPAPAQGAACRSPTASPSPPPPRRSPMAGLPATLRARRARSAGVCFGSSTGGMLEIGGVLRRRLLWLQARPRRARRSARRSRAQLDAAPRPTPWRA